MRAAFNWGCVCIFKAGRVAIVITSAAIALRTAAENRVSTAELKATVRQHPENTHAQLELGLALLRLGRLQEARGPLQKAAADPALTQEARFLLGVDYFESHDGAAAVRSLADLDHSEHAERVLYMLEESYRSLGRQEEARATFHQLNTRYPDGAWMHLLMASAYESQAQPEKAIEEYKLAVGKDSSMPNARFAIGYLYWRQGELEDARKWLQEENSTTACHSLANYYLGEIARTGRDPTEAEARYREAIVCNGKYGDAHLRLGTILSENGRSAEALAQFQVAAKLMPTQSSPHYQMASLYRRMGQRNKAEIEYQMVRALQAKAGETDEKPGVR